MILMKIVFLIFLIKTQCFFYVLERYSLISKLIFIILITCMPKPEKEQLKEKEQLLRKFIEALSKKEINKCNTMVMKMDDPVFNHAKTCINSISLLATFSKQKSEYLAEIKHLKEQIKTLREDKERLNRVKGFKLTQSDKQKNDVLSVFQLLKDGLYLEANRTTLRPLPFIQELVQYSSIKKILTSMRSRQKVEEQIIYGGEQYRQLRKYLRNQYEMFDNLSKQMEVYMSKIDGISDEQEWPKPKCIHDFLFAEFKNIQLKLRVYLNKNRCLSEIINQNPSELSEYSMVQLAKSTNYDAAINQEQKQMSSRIREVHRLFAKNSNRSLINKTTMEILSQIEDYILKLQKANEYLSSKLNMNNEQVNDKIVIMSLQQRVAQLEKIQQKLIEGFKNNLRHFKMLQSQYVIEQIYNNDVENLLLVFGRAVNGLLLQRDEKEEQLYNLIRERDNYKNEFNKLNLLSNISQQMQSQLEMMRNSSSGESSYEELTIRIEELEINITSLERDKEEMTKIINIQNVELQQLKKTIKQRQKELSDIKSQIYAQEKHMKSHIKSQMEKIKVLQFQNSQSLLNSVRSDGQSFEYQSKMVRKQSNEFLKAIRQVPQSKETERLNKLTAQIEQLQGQNQKINDEISALNKQNLKLKETCGSFQKKIRKKQAQIQDLVEFLAQKDKMLEQTYNFNKELQERNNSDAGLKQVTSVIVESILKSKSQQKKKTCDECKVMITENEQYKQKVQELKNRIQQLYKKNLKIYEQSLKLGKDKKFLSEQKEKIKQILYNVQKQLQQSQTNSKALSDKMSKVQQTNKSLKNQNQQLRSTISSRAVSENQYIPRPVESANLNSQLPNKPHLFTAKGIFQANQERQRQFLISTLESQIGPIYQTKFLYSFDSLNKVNFHRYIDNHKHLVLIIKTIYGKLIAGYSESEVSINGTYRGAGMLLALWSSQVFPINQGKKPITYDDYFLIYGNSQLRIKSQQDRVFSNFGIANGYFHSQKKKVQHLLGQNQREIDIQTYEIYSVVFQGDRY